VSAQYSADEIIELTHGRMAQGMVPDEAATIAVDTRQNLEGSWFVALPGRNFDGHDFLGDAFCGGALGCIVEDRASYAIGSTGFPLIAVDDTQEALGRLAANWRKRLRKKLTLVIAESAGGSAEQSKSALALSRSIFESGQTIMPASASFAAVGAAPPNFSPADEFEDDAAGRLCGPDCFYVDWRVGVSEILCSFLNIDDEQAHIVADFGPRPLDRSAFLVSVLRPDLIIFTEGGFQYDRVSGEHAEPMALLRSIMGAVEKFPPLYQTKTNAPAAPLVFSLDQGLAGALGVPYLSELLDKKVKDCLGL